MKFIRFSMLALLGLTVATTTQADIVINSGQNDVCEMIAGHWTGNGKAVELGLITCIYSGNADITSSAPGKININNLSLDLKPKESSFLCPSHEALSLSGECHNGKIIIHTPAANLDGQLSSTGKQANVTGTVTFHVPVIGKISPNVDMILNKVSS